jgi:hypothetical protein
MRRISATYVFPISSPPVKYGIVALNQESYITEVIDNDGIPVEISSLEYFNGILVPGFIRINFLNDPGQNTRDKGRQSFERGIRASIDIQGKTAEYSQGKKISWTNYNSKGDICPNQELDSLELFEESKINLYYRYKINGGERKSNDIVASLNSDILQNYKDLKDLPLWYVVSRETIELFEKRELTAFFRENLNRIVFSWCANETNELWTLLNYFFEPLSGINLMEVLKPLTINPAKMIRLSEVLGQIKTGFQPGINLVEGIDFKEMLPVWENTKIRRLA